MKKRLTLCAALGAVFLAGCGNNMPACDSDEVTKLVKEQIESKLLLQMFFNSQQNKKAPKVRPEALHKAIDEMKWLDSKVVKETKISSTCRAGVKFSTDSIPLYLEYTLSKVDDKLEVELDDNSVTELYINNPFNN